jgi:hypothetical protein
MALLGSARRARIDAAKLLDLVASHRSGHRHHLVRRMSGGPIGCHIDYPYIPASYRHLKGRALADKSNCERFLFGGLNGISAVVVTDPGDRLA